MAKLLKGDAVIHDIRQWCASHIGYGSSRPVMACVFFNTDEDALDFVRIKAHIAKLVSVFFPLPFS